MFGFTQKDRELIQAIAKRQDDEEYTITGALTNPLEIGNLAKKLNPILKEYGVVKILMTRNDLLI